MPVCGFSIAANIKESILAINSGRLRCQYLRSTSAFGVSSYEVAIGRFNEMLASFLLDWLFWELLRSFS